MSDCDIGRNYYWMMIALDDYKVWRHLMTEMLDDCKVRWNWYRKILSFDDKNRRRQKQLMTVMLNENVTGWKYSLSNCDIGRNYYWMMIALDDYKVWRHLMTEMLDDCKVRWNWYRKILSFDDKNRRRQKQLMTVMLNENVTGWKHSLSDCDIGGNYYWMMTALDDYKVWNHLMTARLDDCKVRWNWYQKKL